MRLKALKMFQRGFLFVDYFSQERVQVHTLPSFYYACLNCPRGILGLFHLDSVSYSQNYL